MSMIKRYVENLAYKYSEAHPELSWEEVMDIVCKGNDQDEKIE